MGPEEQLSWKDEALDFLLQAIAGMACQDALDGQSDSGQGSG